jgi:uncharacterized protein (TIGR02118 family)
MIKVSVMYPNESGKHFDIDYYCNKHMALVKELVGSALQRVAVAHGISGGAPGSAAPYLAIGDLYFESVETFKGSFGPHTRTIMADTPKFTNATAVVQISEVKM